MKRLPRVTGKECVRALEMAGFIVARSKGSHFMMKHSDGRKTEVPVHQVDVLGPGLLKRNLTDAEKEVDDFRELLR